MSDSDALEGLDLETLTAMQAKLLGDRHSFDALSEEEIERYLDLNARIRLAGRVAAKPAGNGRKKKPNAPEASLDDLMDL